MAVLKSGTTIAGYTAIHTNNISTYALTSIPATISPTNIYVGNAIYFGGANNYFNWDGARINSNVGIQSTSDMRAPIFYDSNDTTYYVDANDVSQLHITRTSLRAHKNMTGYGPGTWVEDFSATPISSMTFGQDKYSGGPSGTWWFQVNMRHNNPNNLWGTQLAYGWEDNANEIYQRNVTGGTWSGWVRYINTNNYSGILDGRYYTESEVDSLLSAKQNASTAITTSNWSSYAAPRAYVTESYVEFTIEGDANTYYPVTIHNWNGSFSWQRYSIHRSYSDTAPWDPIGTGVHRGGLTFAFEWAGDIAWGGNDKSIRVIEFNETYTQMVAGLQLANCEGVVVWLRGGGAYYRLHGPGGRSQSYSINMSTWTSCAGVQYEPRSYDGTRVNTEINSRYPIRGIGNGDIFVNNQAVIHSGNIGSQSVSYASSAGSATSAGNADTLDSLDSSEFARGRAAYQVLNLDTVKQPGLYQYDGGIGGTQPEGTDQANLRTIEIGSGGRYTQMAFDWASEQAWFRRQTGSEWSTWREFIHSGNIGSQSVTYATSSTRLYASDNPYTYGNTNPYYLYMNYDGGSYWELKVSPATPGTVKVAYANSAGNADTVDSLHASVFVRNDIYNSADAGLQVFRNIGTNTGSWQDANHTFGLENSDNGNIVINFHRAGYTSNNLLYTGSAFRFDTTAASTSDFRAPIFYDSNDTNYYGDFAGFSRMSEIGVTNHYVYNYDSIESGRATAEFGNVGKYVATRNATGDYPSFSFEHVYGTFAWGQIARFHIRQSGADRPSIQFSSGSSNDRWNIGFCTGSDNNFRITQNMGYRPDGSGVTDSWGTPRLIMNTSGVVDVPQGYVSNGNPWNTANSAFFPNGITTAGSANWIYGTTTYIGNAPGNGAGHEFSASGTQYSTSSITTPLFLVNNHSDNTRGYRIYNTSNSSVSAMFVNSSNQLVIAAGAVDQINLNKKVYVNGVALGVNVAPSATAGRIDASNDIVAYSSSDERLKYNITPIENAIDKVKSLTGIEFDWKPEYKHAHGYEGHDTGIIAQQVQEVIPSAVRTNDTGFLAVRYEKLIGLLIEGMKEQQAQIEELKAKLDGLTK